MYLRHVFLTFCKATTLAGMLVVFSFAVLGCTASAVEQNTCVKVFDEHNSVTLSFFGFNVDVNSWPQDIVSEEGTVIHLVEDKAEYYAEEGQEAFRDFLESRLSSNEVDLYTLPAEDVINFSKQGYWQDLSDLNAISNLSSDALAQSTYDGKVFSIPLTYTGFGFYWNKDLLDAHGLTIPTNLGEFLSVCEALKQAGITPYVGNKGYALTAPVMAVSFAELYASSNKDQLLADLSSGKTPISTYVEKGFEFMELLIQKGYLDVNQAANYAPREDDYEAFYAQTGAFICDSLNQEIINDAPFEVVATAMPVLENGSVAVVGADNRIALNPRSTSLTYAIETLEAIGTAENLKAMAQSEQKLAAVPNNDIAYLGSENEILARTILSDDQIPNQEFRLHFNTWITIRDLCRELLTGSSAHDLALRYDETQLQEIALYG